jgi:hypothetical protein
MKVPRDDTRMKTLRMMMIAMNDYCSHGFDDIETIHTIDDVLIVKTRLGKNTTTRYLAKNVISIWRLFYQHKVCIIRSDWSGHLYEYEKYTFPLTIGYCPPDEKLKMIE